MGEVIYWLCADLFVLGAELSSATLPPPAELRQRLLGMLERMVGAARAANVPEADIAEARYALVAFFDEQVLKSDWPGRSEWMSQPLQLLLYREYTAGENFFARMNGLLQQGGRQTPLQIYYVCLLLGFRGAYATGGREAALASFVDAAQKQLAPSLPSPTQISPNAAPRDRARAGKRSNLPFYAVLGGCLLVILGVVSGLQLSLRSSTNETVDNMSSPIRAAR